MTTTRVLYLVAYDIRDKARIRRIQQLIQPLSVGGQKSAYECWLSLAEKQRAVTRCQQVMARQDSLLLIRLIRPDKAMLLGKAAAVPAPGYLYLG